MLSSPTSVQEADETTRSDISERPSVDDVESETGSTGALENPQSQGSQKVSVILAALPFKKKCTLFIVGLCWVLVAACRLSLFSESGGYLLLQCGLLTVGFAR